MGRGTETDFRAEMPKEINHCCGFQAEMGFGNTGVGYVSNGHDSLLSDVMRGQSISSWRCPPAVGMPS